MTDQFQRIDLPAASEQDRAIQRVAEATHRLNEAVQRAVSKGVSVEIIRVSRYHDGAGSWGDQVVPTIRQKEADAASAAS
ncbi:hypothetical protein [Paracoccus pacificus]|uniref:4-oxalocrotonate tautomerase n=1 Tax=Paracoccus pacificus TaxID=1463598 RepID=A0ABW4R8P7_9RHOB